ncbi:PcfJ domain-containing protein [Vibrio owensii]|uniref:PcfJ domain-containing protein n=1 Tax=Vibrio owensii TaxID=696485 RepID=UPI0018F2079A|nr:PcfJ domain-containing protein [Vibrio owensii]
MNFIEQLESPEVLEKVLSILKREFKALPDFGTIAGGAVASAVFEALDIKELNIKRYKDLDVFHTPREFDSTSIEEDNPKRFPPKKDENNPRSDRMFLRKRSQGIKATFTNSFEGRIGTSISSRNMISIDCSITTDLNHNYVQIDGLIMTRGSHGLSQTIVQSFDLTNSAIGITPDRTKFVYTAGFINFLYQKTVNIQLLETANHTLIRYLDACQHFSQKPDEIILNRLADAITLIAKLTEKHQTNRYSYNPTPYLHGYLFSNVYQSRAAKHKKLLAKLGLKLTPISIGRRHYSTAKRATLSILAKQYLAFSYGHHCWESRTRCLYQMRSNRSLSGASQDIYKLLEDRKSTFPQVYAGLLNYTLNMDTNKGFAKDKEYMSWFDVYVKVNYPNIKLNGINGSNFESLIYLVAGHNTQLILEIADHYGKSNRAGAAIKGLKWLDKHNVAMFGLLENAYMTRNYRNISRDIYLKQMLLNLDDIRKLKILADRRTKIHHLTVHQRNFVPRHTKALQVVNALFKDKNIYCEEIHKEYDLVALGEQQHHCVGGYFDAIADNEGSIFKVSGPGKKDVSTLFISHPEFDQEHYYEGDDGHDYTADFYIVEHRTYRNDPPIAEHTEFAQELRNHLQTSL